MTLTDAVAAFPKPEKPIRGTAAAVRYMALVAQLPCIVCRRYGVELHHPIHGRFAQRKASDLDVIPMCDPCHRSLHAAPDVWRKAYGPDTDFIPKVREAVERLRRNTIGGR